MPAKWMLGCLVVMTAVVTLQCREGAPIGDPKTPVNSPIPDVDHREPDPKPGPSFSLPDAG